MPQAVAVGQSVADRTPRSWAKLSGNFRKLSQTFAKFERALLLRGLFEWLFGGPPRGTDARAPLPRAAGEVRGCSGPGRRALGRWTRRGVRRVPADARLIMQKKKLPPESAELTVGLEVPARTYSE